MKTPLKKTALSITAVLLGIHCNANATIAGITGDRKVYNNLEKNAIYKIDTISSNTNELGRVTKIGNTFYDDSDDGSGNAKGYVTGNQLAYDYAHETYYYMDNKTNLYRFKENDTSGGGDGHGNYFLADLSDTNTVTGGNEMPIGSTGTGGGDFYNGAYYYTPESDTPAIYRVAFTPNGDQFTSQTKIIPGNLGTISTAGDGLGDFGDVAIQTSTGYMYGSSGFEGPDENGAIDTHYTLWKIDLNSQDHNMTVLNYNLGNVLQLAFDENGVLWGNRWKTNEGKIRKINLTTGAFEDAYNIQDNHTGSWANTKENFFDLATVSAPVPEPSSTLLFLSSLPLLFKRKRM